MKPSLVLGLALVATGCVHPPPPAPSLEEQIRREFVALERAVVQRDADAIGRLVADEYTFTQPDTFVSGKQELLASIKPDSPFVYLQHEVVEIKVRGYGITAVSNGRFAVKGQYKGKVASEMVRFTAVHVLRDGRWQLVALHSAFEGKDK